MKTRDEFDAEDAYNRGYGAQNGRFNPYAPDSKLHRIWSQGYRANPIRRVA